MTSANDADIEVAEEMVVCLVATNPLSGEQPEQVSALVPRSWRVDARVGGLASPPWSGDRSGHSRGCGTRSEVGRPLRQLVAVQFLKGDDADIDGVTEGASLGAGFRHADQVRE